MKYRAILFDMDGTLVPMDSDTFTKGYFKILFAKLAKYQLNPQDFGRIMWTGVGEMVKNDGTKTNEEAFWRKFEELTGILQETIGADCIDFYGNEFDLAKQFTQENRLAEEAVRLARKRADKVVLATNPIFPMVGQKTRMNWVGLKPEDFDLVTSYEADRFCKPNPNYFLSVCERIGVKPSECLMIGNDEREDMYAGTAAGMNCYLVTDWMIPSESYPWNGPRGSFSEMVEMLRNLD